MKSGSDKGQRKPEKNRLEWVVFGVSAVLLAALTVYLVREAVRPHDRPPEIVVQIGQVRESGGTFMVPVEARNDGDQPAEDMTIVVRLTVGGEERERAELAFSYLPRGSTHSGWVSFRTDPRKGRLETGAFGYSVP